MLYSSIHHSIDRIGIQQRLPTKGHHCADVVCRRDLAYRIGRNLRIDPFTARLMITLGAVLTVPCAGIRYEKFDFIQIFQIWIFHVR